VKARSYTRLPNGTTWPRLNTDHGHDARYGTPDPLTLAGFVDAYNALTALPRARREEVIRGLRADACKRDDMGDVIPDTEAAKCPRCGGGVQRVVDQVDDEPSTTSVFCTGGALAKGCGWTEAAK
jgi:hypothetical protein